MSGFYQNWIKVQNSNLSNDIVPMQSGGFQKPFYFGGSNIPTALKMNDTDLNLTGSGLSSYNKTDFLPYKVGKGVQKTHVKKHTNIHIPRYIKM